jgi:hypothetical protein
MVVLVTVLFIFTRLNVLPTDRDNDCCRQCYVIYLVVTPQRTFRLQAAKVYRYSPIPVQNILDRHNITRVTPYNVLDRFCRFLQCTRRGRLVGLFGNCGVQLISLAWVIMVGYISSLRRHCASKIRPLSCPREPSIRPTSPHSGKPNAQQFRALTDGASSWEWGTKKRNRRNVMSDLGIRPNTRYCLKMYAAEP